MPLYLLDTNTVSHCLKGHPHALRRLVATPMSDLCLSTVTEGELRYGLAKRPEATRLLAAVNELLCRVDVLPWDRAAAGRYGVLRAALSQQGKALGALDMMIAGHALSVGAILVSSNGAFRHVQGLTIEDWAE